MHLHIVGTVTKYKFIKSESQVNDCFSDFSHSFPIAVETFDTFRNSGRDFFVFISNVLSFVFISNVLTEEGNLTFCVVRIIKKCYDCL